MSQPPPPPSSTPIKPLQSASSSSTHSLQTNFVRSSSKSSDTLDMDCGNRSLDDSSQRSSRLFQSFQWSNVFNGRNSKSTSQLNLVNCDKNNIATTMTSVPIDYSDAPHDQHRSKGLKYSASNFLIYFAPHQSLRFHHSLTSRLIVCYLSRALRPSNQSTNSHSHNIVHHIWTNGPGTNNLIT